MLKVTVSSSLCKHVVYARIQKPDSQLAKSGIFILKVNIWWSDNFEKCQSKDEVILSEKPDLEFKICSYGNVSYIVIICTTAHLTHVINTCLNESVTYQ